MGFVVAWLAPTVLSYRAMHGQLLVCSPPCMHRQTRLPYTLFAASTPQAPSSTLSCGGNVQKYCGTLRTDSTALPLLPLRCRFLCCESRRKGEILQVAADEQRRQRSLLCHRHFAQLAANTGIVAVHRPARLHLPRVHCYTEACRRQAGMVLSPAGSGSQLNGPPTVPPDNQPPTSQPRHLSTAMHQTEVDAEKTTPA